MWRSKNGRHYVSHFPISIFPQLLMDSRNSSMDVKPTSPFTRAEDSRPKPPALHDAADTMQKAKLEHFLHEMAEFEKKYGKHRSSCSGCHLRFTYFAQRPKHVRPRKLPSPVLESENSLCAFINSLLVSAKFQTLSKSMTLPPRCALARFPSSLRRSTR